MGNGVDRSSSPLDPTPDPVTFLRDLTLSQSQDVRGQIRDVLKGLTINGHGVTGSGLNFAVGNTGLGVDENRTERGDTFAEATAVPVPVARPITAPFPTQEGSSRGAFLFSPPAPPQSPAISVDDVEESIPQSPPGPTPENVESGVAPVVIAGAVNGVPAQAVIGVFSPFAPI